MTTASTSLQFSQTPAGSSPLAVVISNRRGTAGSEVSVKKRNVNVPCHGWMNKDGSKRYTAAQRLWMRVDKRSPDECWSWIGSLGVGGYGYMLDDDGKGTRPCRVAWSTIHGPIPSGMCVCHHCDRPRCCNPSHLFIGTQNDNIQDMKLKGRARTRSRRGEESPTHKLTWAKVLKMRSMYATGDYTIRELGTHFGVHRATAREAIRFVTWRPLSSRSPFPGELDAMAAEEKEKAQ